MSHTDFKITKPVTTQDVAVVVGVASNDVGTLCSSEKINKWAKYKPVKYAAPCPDRSGDWWRANDKRCGFVVVKTNDYRNIPSMYSEDFIENGWEYDSPDGGELAPYRLADFDNYDKRAMPLYNKFVFTEEVAVGKPFTAELSENIMLLDSISLGDILSHDGETVLSDFYFGVVFLKSDGTYFKRITSTNTQGTNFTTELPDDFILGQKYMAYPFLSKVPFGWTTLDYVLANDALYYPIPNVGPVEMTVVSAQQYTGIYITVTGRYITQTRANVTVSIESRKRDITITQATLYLRTTEAGSPLVGDDRMTTLAPPAITVSQGEIWNGAYTFSNLSQQSYGQYFIHVQIRVDGILYEQQGQLFMESVDI